MKLSYLFVGLVLIAFIVGCAEKTVTPPATPPSTTTPPATPPAETPATPPAETPATTTPTTTYSDADQEKIDRLKVACEKGNVGVCEALKSRYGIEMQPKSTATEGTTA